MRRPLSTLAALVLAAGALVAAQNGRSVPLGPQDRSEGALRPGDPAPDFTLEPRGGGTPVRLSSFRDKSPVALVFGSYT